jgi:hypothetical protein
MASQALPDAGPPVRPADLQRARAWLARHGLGDAPPTPLLAARLAARWRAHLADQIMLAGLIIAASLTQAYDRIATGKFGGYEPRTQTPLLILMALVAILLLVRTLLDRWVRRVDQRAGATLSRRAAHPVQPRRRDILGRPYAAFTVATFTGAFALAVSALTVQDSTMRYSAPSVSIPRSAR